MARNADPAALLDGEHRTDQEEDTMSKHLPPVPPAGRSTKGPAGGPESASPDDAGARGNREVPANLKEQDRQGNTKQNTTHQGYQQDR